MAGEDIRLGPFVDGLNTFSDASSIGDTELVECVNFEIDIDGSLVSRPPIIELSTFPLAATGNMLILGFFTTESGGNLLFASDGNTSTYYFNGTSWVLVTNTFAASSMCQYRNEAWLVAPLTSANPGGKWSLTGGFTADTDMPRGDVIVAHKERLWIGLGGSASVNGTRLYLSDIVLGAPDWAGNYIDIGQGDGQNIVDIAVYYSDLVIFKQGSTFRFSYDADPSVGSVQKISANVGAMGKNCWASYENQLYVLFDNKVYMFTNYNYDRLNMRVPLKANNPSVTLSEKASISVWSDRLIVAFYDRTYVYSLRTRTWTEWKSSRLENIGRLIPLPNNQATNPTAYTYSTKPRESKIYTIKEELNSFDSEPIFCSMQTKNYDYQVAHRYKRLFWWGLDAFSRSEVSGYTLPVSYSVSVTWDQLAAYTWDQLTPYTWDRPLDVSLVVQDDVTTEGLTGGRKFIKFRKSDRFRQIAFRVTGAVDGTTNTAPLRIYSILTLVKDKQVVSKKIS